MNDIHPNRLPTDIPLFPMLLEGVGIICFFLLLSGIWWWWKRRHQAKETPAPIPQKPMTTLREETLAALEKLRREAENLSVREGFFALSEILRNYFVQHSLSKIEKDVFSPSALTFHEILKNFPDKILKQFFIQCERGEFAEHPLTQKDIFTAIDRAKELVIRS